MSRPAMTSAVKITSPNGAGQGLQVAMDGVKVGHLTGVDVSIGVGQVNTVRLHMVALAQDIEIAAEIAIGGAAIPPAVELALLEYLEKKYPREIIETTAMESTSQSFALGERAPAEV